MSTIGSNQGQQTESSRNSRHSQAIRDDLKAYADGELSRLRRWRISRHLSGCAACRKEIMGLNRVSEELKNLPGETPRSELRARILASLPDTTPAPTTQRRSPRIDSRQPRLAFTGAVSVLVLAGFSALAVLHSGTQHNAVQPPPVQATHPAPGAFRETALADPSIQSQRQSASTSAGPTLTANSTEMTDETSKKADEILSAHLDELDRAVQRARQASRQQALLAAAGTQPAHEPSATHREHALLVAVADISAAKARLQNLVQTVGGSLTDQQNGMSAPPPTGSGMPSIVNHGADPAGAVAGPASVVSITVPSSAAGRLTSGLHQIGVASVWKRSGDRPIAASTWSHITAMPTPRALLDDPGGAALPIAEPGKDRIREDARRRMAAERHQATTTFIILLQAAAK